MSTIAAETRAPEAEDSERRAYNAAFWQLGFSWRWDAETYRELAKIPHEKERIRAYLERHQPHLLRAYNVEFLCEMIRARKADPAAANAFSVNSATRT
ncbi:MAG: hypothetical protein FJY54_13020 [Betaproteobacteria bacterium]|nr:hypothetical protein [Betaproteobacteria bacterium]